MLKGLERLRPAILKPTMLILQLAACFLKTTMLIPQPAMLILQAVVEDGKQREADRDDAENARQNDRRSFPSAVKKSNGGATDASQKGNKQYDARCVA